MCIASFATVEKMRKDHLHRRSKEVEAANESEAENGDPLSGSADPFDALVNSKADESASSKTNGKKAPSPIADDSDAENDAAKNDATSETNGDSADSADNGDGNGDTDNVGEGEDEGYEVESIVAHKFKGKKKLFKIRWKNYGEDDDTWELEENLACPEIIERYLAENPDANQSQAKPKKEKKVSKFQIVFVRPCRWYDDFNKSNCAVLLKVRISLPSEAPTRATPKRTAAERKTIVDDPLSDGEEIKSKKKSARGRPKKGGKSVKKKEYEVQKIVDDELRNGKKFYRIRWKGWGAKDDTWEPKSSLSCPDIIKAYESSKSAADDQDYEVEKIVGEKIEYGKRYFLVKWKGWPESDNSWETEKSVDCFELIEKFRDSCRSATKSNKRPSSAAPKSKKAKKARKIVEEDDEDDDDNDDDDDDDAGEKEWEVEKIVNVRKARGGKKEYLIRWKGCKASEDTWEPEDGISCSSLITAFLKKNKK